eukprot:12881496-Prorocentrum_lima.AAC.1
MPLPPMARNALSPSFKLVSAGWWEQNWQQTHCQVLQWVQQPALFGGDLAVTQEEPRAARQH